MGQVALQRDLLAAGRLKVVHRLLQLRQIVQPLLAALGPQRFFVSALVQRRRQNLGHRTLGVIRRKAVDQPDKLFRLRALENTVLQVLHKGVVQGAAVLRRVLLQKSNPPLAYVPPGRVGNPQKREIVLIGDHPEITQRVLDLHSLEKLGPAVNGVGDFFLQKDLLNGPADIVRPDH